MWCVCRECVWDVRFGVLVLWCAVLRRYGWCWCLCWCAMCGVWCLWCVCGVVCVVCVWRGLARGKPFVCSLKTSPCVGSKRIRVYRQNARMCSTCARFASTHGSVLNLHTETKKPTHGKEGRGVGWGFSSLLFSSLLFSSLLFSSLLFSSLLFSSLLFSSLLFSSLLFSSLFPLLSFLSSLSATMTMITRPVGSLCTHGSNLPDCQSACTLADSLFGEHVRIMQETTVLV